MDVTVPWTYWFGNSFIFMTGCDFDVLGAFHFSVLAEDKELAVTTFQ